MAEDQHPFRELEDLLSLLLQVLVLGKVLGREDQLTVGKVGTPVD